ncbi:MAG: thioester reductase domain-containing protein [Rhizonema sp. PD37]|nr:thioester reductase domain-containing protein [Rhizonema sp. PD37]
MIFRSTELNISIPEQSLTSIVLQRAIEFADKPAMIDGLTSRTITYSELADSINRVAAGFAAWGFSQGDVVAIYSPNCLEYPIAFQAIASLGGVSSTANPSYTASELAYQLNDAGAKYLLTVPELLERGLEAASQSKVESVFVFGNATGAIPFSVLLENSHSIPKVQINPKEDAVALPYSSGTTGLPKGVTLTHYNLVANMYQLSTRELISPADTIIGLLPFFHSYGLQIFLNYSLYCGATVVVMPQFDLETFLSLVHSYKITRAHLVPPIVLALAKQPIVDKYDLSSLKVITSGAAPLGHELTLECEQRLNCIIKQVYGLTETSPVTHINPDERAKIKSGSVGPCMRNTECQIVDIETEKPLGFHEQGELWIRGPQVMLGYLNNPEATAKVIDADGWFHTGDIAYVDEDGYFYIVDRIKELIKYNGYPIAPAELEAVLLSHPAVVDAAVIPSPHPSTGEVPKGFVVLKSVATAEEIMEFAAELVAPHKRIRRLEIVDIIPKSASGKILRRLLVQREIASVGEKPPEPQLTQNLHLLQQLASSSDETTRQELLVNYIRENVIKVLGLDEAQYLDLQKPLNEMGLNSLSNIDLKNRIDTELDVNLPIEILLVGSNIYQLVNILLEQLTSKSIATHDVIDLEAEVILDPAIYPEHSYDSFITEPTAIFLTGATGFLGAFLLQELLQQTQADIYCLVRENDNESAQRKVQKNLESYGIWQEAFHSRIIPILGDLSKFQLGLSTEDFQEIASQIDVIYHSAAWLNYVYPYEALKPSNVLGTQEIFRLASFGKVKPVHHISTVAVFESSFYLGKTVSESDPLVHSSGMKLSYSQSKWVAEKLAMIARERGIPVSIYRPPFISGHSQTGAWYTDDVICRMIKGCIQMGCMTDITDILDLSPVDYVSKSIVDLSRQREALGKSFHLNNPQPTSWNQLTDFIRSLGYPIEYISYQNWQSQLNNQARSQSNPLYPLLPFFLKNSPQYQQAREPEISCQVTQTSLAESLIICPPVDTKLLNTYFDYFICSGFLDAK